MAQAVSTNPQAAPDSSRRVRIVRPPSWLFPERRLLVVMGSLTVAYAVFWLGGPALWAWHGAVNGVAVPSVLGWAGEGSLRTLLLAVPPIAVGGVALALGHRRQSVIRQQVKTTDGRMCPQCGAILGCERPSCRCCECGSAVDVSVLRDFWTQVAQPRHLPAGWSGRIAYIVGLCAIAAAAQIAQGLFQSPSDWPAVARSITAGVVTVGPGIWLVQQLWIWAVGRLTSSAATRSRGLLPGEMHVEPRGTSPGGQARARRCEATHS